MSKRGVCRDFIDINLLFEFEEMVGDVGLEPTTR